jgi:hypothetical protein
MAVIGGKNNFPVSGLEGDLKAGNTIIIESQEKERKEWVENSPISSQDSQYSS